MRRLAFTLLLVATAAVAGPKLPKTLMTVKLKDADASSFFRLIAEKANADLIVSDCADTKTINLNLRNVELDALVHLVAAQYDLDVTYDGKTFQVDCARSP